MAAGVAAVVNTVNVVGPDVGTDGGLNDADAPAGSPLTPNETVPVKPEAAVTEIVYAALVPAVTVLEDGVADKLKPPTVIVRLTGLLVTPPLPVTVSDAV